MMDISRVLQTIETVSHGRKVQLIGVTKTVEAARIREAYSAGLHTFGENRIQEAIPKIKELNDLDLQWHFIGHLQTNKVRDAVDFFQWIQSVDSVKLLNEIEKQAAKRAKKMDLLLELNLGQEQSKHGFSPDAILEALELSKQLQWCKIRGLMTVPPYSENPEEVRPFFRELRQIRDRWSAEFPELVELSMGMSNDYMVAIEEGATIVRIGTALFGTRP